MPALNALDYSWSRPDPSLLKANAVLAVARYLWGAGKGIDDGERRALHAQGRSPVANYEGDSGAVLGGYARGQADARAALGWLRLLGWPQGLPVYFSADTDVRWQLPVALDYYRGVKSVLAPFYETRAYGQAQLLDALAAAGIARFGWQTVAWSDGQLSAHAVLYQWAIDQSWYGSSVDFNSIIDIVNLGAWWAPGMEPVHVRTDMEEEMALSSQAQAQIAALLDQKLGWWLPRLLASIRFGSGNRAYNPANTGGAVDNYGTARLTPAALKQISDLIDARLAAHHIGSA